MIRPNVPDSPFLIQSFHRSELAGQQKMVDSLLPSHRPVRPVPTSLPLCYIPVRKGTIKILRKIDTSIFHKPRHLYKSALLSTLSIVVLYEKRKNNQDWLI